MADLSRDEVVARLNRLLGLGWAIHAGGRRSNLDVESMFIMLLSTLETGGGSLGPPIPGASFVIAVPQIGDDTEGEVDGVWHPALGAPLFSLDPLAPNGLHLEANSVVMISRLPDPIFSSSSDEIWELKHIGGYLRMDGGAPSLDNSSGIRGEPLGGSYGEAHINRAAALQAIAESRWRPFPDQPQPYPNYRLILEVFCYRESIGAPIFKPSRLFSTGATTTTGSGFSIGSGGAVLSIGDGDQVLGI